MKLKAPPMMLLLAGLLVASSAIAVDHAASIQVRQYGTHRYFEDRPFTGGDFGYGAAYQLRDDMGYWQLGALYTPDAGNDGSLDYAITPALSVVFKKKIGLAGLGINKTYMGGTDAKDDWTDLYWNFLGGVELPFKKHFSFTGLALYDFEGWNKLDDFRFEDVEFLAAANILF